MVVEAGVARLEAGALTLLVDKADVREAGRGRLNQEELSLLLKIGLSHWESWFHPLVDRLNSLDEVSLLLSWGVKLDFTECCLGHCKGLGDTKVVFLDSSFSKEPGAV